METLQIENCQKNSYIYIYKKMARVYIVSVLNPEAWTDSLNRSAEDTVSGHSVLLTVGVMLLPEATVYAVNHSTTVFVTTL